jgi:excisionase family DNA binding protein
VNDHLSTREVGWIIGESASTVRRMIRDGDIAASRVAGGFRVSRAEVLRVARQTVEEKAGRKLADRELERLIDEVISTNEAELADAAAAPMKPTSTKRRPRRG